MTNVAREMLCDTSMLDATTFLSAGDQEIVNLFAKYERVQSVTEKRNIVKTMCELSVINMQIEEEIFHPVLKLVLKEKGIVSAVTMSHARLKYLISEIEHIDADSEIYDIKMRVLGEHVKEYVKEKQTKLFPKANASGKIDLWRLGVQLAMRKEELRNMHVNR